MGFRCGTLLLVSPALLHCFCHRVPWLELVEKLCALDLEEEEELWEDILPRSYNQGGGRRQTAPRTVDMWLIPQGSLGTGVVNILCDLFLPDVTGGLRLSGPGCDNTCLSSTPQPQKWVQSPAALQCSRLKDSVFDVSSLPPSLLLPHIPFPPPVGPAALCHLSPTDSCHLRRGGRGCLRDTDPPKTGELGAQTWPLGRDICGTAENAAAGVSRSGSRPQPSPCSTAGRTPSDAVRTAEWSACFQTRRRGRRCLSLCVGACGVPLQVVGTAVVRLASVDLSQTENRCANTDNVVKGGEGEAAIHNCPIRRRVNPRYRADGLK